MTFARREEILSKDILRIEDVMELNDMSYQSAAKLVRDIKRVMKSQLQINGRVSTNDYIKFFDNPKQEEEPVVELKKIAVKPRTSAVREIPLFRVKEYAMK